MAGYIKMLWANNIPSTSDSLWSNWLTLSDGMVNTMFFEVHNQQKYAMKTSYYTSGSYIVSPISRFSAVAVTNQVHHPEDSWRYALLVVSPNNGVQRTGGTYTYPGVEWYLLNSGSAKALKRNTFDGYVDYYTRLDLPQDGSVPGQYHFRQWFGTWCWSGGLVAQDISLVFDKDDTFSPTGAVDTNIYVDDGTNCNLSGAAGVLLQKSLVPPFYDKYYLGEYPMHLGDVQNTLKWFFGFFLSVYSYNYYRMPTSSRGWLNEFSDRIVSIMEEYLNRIGNHNFICIEITIPVGSPSYSQPYVKVYHKTLTQNTIYIRNGGGYHITSYGYSGEIYQTIGQCTCDTCTFVYDSSLIIDQWTHSWSSEQTTFNYDMHVGIDTDNITTINVLRLTNIGLNL